MMKKKKNYGYGLIFLVAVGAILLLMSLTPTKEAVQDRDHSSEQQYYGSADETFGNITIENRTKLGPEIEAANKRNGGEEYFTILNLYEQMQRADSIPSLNQLIEEICSRLYSATPDIMECRDLFFKMKADAKNTRALSIVIDSDYTHITKHDINTVNGRLFYFFEKYLKSEISFSARDVGLYSLGDNRVEHSIQTTLQNLDYTIAVSKVELPKQHLDQMALAQSKDTNPLVLDRLAQDGDLEVKLQILENPNVSKRALRMLMKDPDRTINITAGMKMELLNNKNKKKSLREIAMENAVESSSSSNPKSKDH